jgi:hypothetical protein
MSQLYVNVDGYALAYFFCFLSLRFFCFSYFCLYTMLSTHDNGYSKLHACLPLMKLAYACCYLKCNLPS